MKILERKFVKGEKVRKETPKQEKESSKVDEQMKAEKRKKIDNQKRR